MTTRSPGPEPSSSGARLPPRWFVVAFWHTHRAVVRFTRGRLGLWRPKAGRWGALLLTTTGRRSGRTRRVLVGYLEDGGDFVTMAMNGWGAAEPAWWLNLQAHPDATVHTRDGVRRVWAHRAEGAERARLWARWGEIDKDLEAYAARRPRETAVVVLRPRQTAGQCKQDQRPRRSRTRHKVARELADPEGNPNRQPVWVARGGRGRRTARRSPTGGSRPEHSPTTGFSHPRA